MTKRQRVKDWLKAHPANYTTEEIRIALQRNLSLTTTGTLIRAALHELCDEGRVVKLGKKQFSSWYVFKHNYPRQ